MSELDQLAISRVLGSTLQPFSRSGFGGFSAVRVVGEMLAARPAPPAKLQPNVSRDRKLIAAFKKTHKGYSIDRAFADPVLSSRFAMVARNLGIKAPHAAMCRRLLGMRKEGGFPVPTTKVDHRDLAPFLIPAELAFAQLTYRVDASYDDLLVDPTIGAAFDELAFQIGRGMGEIVDYRLAALHLRKNVRTRKPKLIPEMAKIDVPALAPRWHQLGSLTQVVTARVPETEGILSLMEPERHLYLTRHKNLRMGVQVFLDKDVLSTMGNRFWKPLPDKITIEVIGPRDVKGVCLAALELKSLELHRPIFNMPIAA